MIQEMELGQLLMQKLLFIFKKLKVFHYQTLLVMELMEIMEGEMEV